MGRSDALKLYYDKNEKKTMSDLADDSTVLCKKVGAMLFLSIFSLFDFCKLTKCQVYACVCFSTLVLFVLSVHV